MTWLLDEDQIALVLMATFHFDSEHSTSCREWIAMKNLGAEETSILSQINEKPDLFTAIWTGSSKRIELLRRLETVGNLAAFPYLFRFVFAGS